MKVRAMQQTDIDTVVDIEQTNYYEPWTKQIFIDCLKVDYQCLILEEQGEVLGYAILMQVLDEYHLLNIAIKKAQQNHGLGYFLLQTIIEKAKNNQGKHVFLEVRASNQAARHVYKKLGFVEVGVRKDYYSAPIGREDAVLYTLDI